MRQILYCLILLSLNLSALEVTLNTQLDRKLEDLKNKQRANKYQYSILRKIEVKGLKTVPRQKVINELTVVKGDVLDPYVINRNLKRVEGLGLFSKVTSSQVPHEGGKKMDH